MASIRTRGRRLVVGALLLGSLAVAAGCSAEDEPDAASPATDAAEPTSTSETATAPTSESAEDEAPPVEAIATAVSTAEQSPLDVDPTAGPAEATCVAEELVAVMSTEELAAIGLPDDFAGLSSIFTDEDTTRRFLGTMFTCLDMVPMVVEQLGELPEEQARCVAEAVVDDEDVRLLFVLGTKRGSDAPAPFGIDAYLDELGAYTTACA